MMNGFELEGKELSGNNDRSFGWYGTALITTLYGVLLANFIFGPIAGKLETLSKVKGETQNCCYGRYNVYSFQRTSNYC